MCGLVGFRHKGNNYAGGAKRRDIFAELLMIDVVRGFEGTGIAVVTRDGEKREPYIYKRGLRSWDFIDLKPTNRLLQMTCDAINVIGHNRSTTTGSNIDENAHPFLDRHITLAHNGTIYNRSELVKDAVADVDSAHIASGIAEHGADAILPKLHGGYALVWHDAKDGTLNMARNSEKPLFYIQALDEDTIWWASELEMLWWTLNRHGVRVDGKFKTLTPNHHYIFGGAKAGEYVRRPFVPIPYQQAATRTEGGTRWTQSEQSRSRRGTMTDSGGDAGSTTTIRDIGMTDALSKGLANDAPSKNNALPSTKKGRRKAANKLHRLGMILEEKFVVTPLTFVEYKNQAGHGSMLAKHKTQDYYCEMYNVKRTLFDEYRIAKRVYVSACNVKRINNKDVVIVQEDVERQLKYVRMPDVPADLKQKHETASANKEVLPPRVQPDDKGVDYETEREEDTPEFFRGPGQALITKERWDQLTEDGCANCTGFINPSMADEVIWLGASQNCPICHVCSRDVDVMTKLGMDHNVKMESVH